MVKKTTSQKDSNYQVALSDLLEAGVHFGHQSKRWHPKMASFIWQAKDGIHVFDLLKTQECLQKACQAAKDFSASGKKIAFVCTKRQGQAIVKEEAVKAGVPYVVSRWAGGILTNWKQIKKSIDKLNKHAENKENNQLKNFTKKERLMMDKKIAQMERLFGGLAKLTKEPDALFVIDIAREKSAVAEAVAKGVKIFAMVDSNVDPTPIDYPIPGNDDAVRSIKLIVSTFAKAVEEGLKIASKKGNVSL